MIHSSSTEQKPIKILYIIILVLTFGCVYTFIFDSKVSLVGDNASYYILGNALADGAGYTNIHHQEKEAHYHYPPGYPLLIAGISRILGDDIVTIKIANGIFFIGAVLLLFFIIIKLTANNHIAFVSCLLVLMNYHLVGYTTIMMSEMPFLFFSLVSLWLFFTVDFSKKIYTNTVFIALTLCVMFTFYIRSTGLALIASIAFFLVVQKQWKYALTFIGSCIILYFPWWWRSQNTMGNSYLNQLVLKNPYKPELGTMGFTDLLERVFINFERYITKEIPSSMATNVDSIYTGSDTSFTAWLIGFILITGITIGILKLPKFRAFIAVYIVTFVSLLLLWPSVWYGVRFILPLIPCLLFLFVVGTITFLKWITVQIIPKKQKIVLPILVSLLVSVWIFLYGVTSIQKLHTQAIETYAANYKNYFELATWVRDQAPSETVTCVRKEGLFYLFSKKYVTNYPKTTNKEALLEHLKAKNVTYVVVEQLGYSSTARYLVPAIDRYPNKFKVIKELSNPNTYLMKFTPEFGYSGSWKDDMRNGYGIYVWEDGQKYEGYWKDDVRHGKGTVYFQNGESLSGTWKQGKLEGEVIKKDANGQVIEVSMYANNQKVQGNDKTN
ncbi:glycosyltransferase family 39 protein [Kordia zhangzhouensis]|uniref:glycosyltransferase family 39 protein n=1 Tax=Kordia zhangzhouensis TaxID=1620405 RepID=UPI000629AAB5|nr:glycosyltransferase family 39 protein [Kordia zhangzhouensis]